MTELRLTFASEGLAAVSKVLVEMGLSFRVEPAAPAPKVESAAGSQAAPAPKRRTSAKPARKNPAAARQALHPERASPEATAVGAERLRAAIAKSGASYRPLEAHEGAPAAPADDAATSRESDE